MIRQAAFTGNGVFLKGGLHCHTTRSDGAGTPEEVLRLHRENGYDFLAITDHRKYNYKNFAPETGITIVPGMEFDANIPTEKGFRCFHAVCLGPDDETNGYRQDETLESGFSPDQQAFQPYLDRIHEKNNLTFYCHPEWSSTPARYFDKMQGNFAMEIWNSGCVMDNDMDKNAAYWDELLGAGQHIFGVATDDGHAMKQHCRGWVMVNSENTVKAILSALRNGCFYSSTGPELQDFYVEDGVAHLKTKTPCRQICFHADCHPTRMFTAENALLTEAQLDLRAEYRYIRASVVDENGLRAWTNPIFLD